MSTKEFQEAKFQRGDSKGHTNWIDGLMTAIVPPEYQFYLGKLEDLKYVESGHKKISKGFIGHLAGRGLLNLITFIKIKTESCIACVKRHSAFCFQRFYRFQTKLLQPLHAIRYFYPIFGIKGKTLAG